MAKFLEFPFWCKGTSYPIEVKSTKSLLTSVKKINNFKSNKTYSKNIHRFHRKVK